MAAAGVLLTLLFANGVQAAERAPLRILSLDQCADQFVLALAGPGDTLFLSPRADDPDSRLRARASGHKRVRPTLEAALVARPDVVVRYWGGEPRLMRALDGQGVRLVQIEDATDIKGVRRNVVEAARVLNSPTRGAALLLDMDQRLDAAQGPQESALYLTAGGFTAGAGTLIDSLMRAANLTNLAPAPGFGPVSVERLILAPPARMILAFFEQVRADWRGAGRHPVARRLSQRTPSARVDGAVASCPAWFVGEAAQQMRGAAR